MNVEFIHHDELKPPRRGWELRACNVSDDGDMISLWSQGTEGLVTLTSEVGAVARVPLDGVRFPAIGALPGGGFVIADRRVSIDRSSGTRSSTSSWVFNGDGELVIEGSLGDGISHLLTGPHGAIWVGYFDEGV